jgi:hypothetical protein
MLKSNQTLYQMYNVVVIGTDWKGRYKYNYHTIMVMDTQCYLIVSSRWYFFYKKVDIKFSAHDPFLE